MRRFCSRGIGGGSIIACALQRRIPARPIVRVGLCGTPNVRTEECYLPTLKAYAESGQWREAMDLMGAYYLSCFRSLNTFTWELSSRFAKTIHCSGKMQTDLVNVDTASYNFVLQACGKSARVSCHIHSMSARTVSRPSSSSF